MSWELTLILFLAGLLALMLTGIPIAFAFLVVNLIASAALIGPTAGINTLVRSMYDGMAKFTLVPIPLFVLMAELLFRSGLAAQTLDAVGKWLGAIPGRLSVLSIAGGAVLAALSGSAMANTAMLGSLLVPEMTRRGYSKQMAVGPILAAGGLAMLIPPSAMAVLVGTIGEISIGKMLIGGVVPGLILATASMGYIIVRSIMNPSEAPAYQVEKTPLADRLRSFARDILPLGSIILLVVGIIFFGIATPTEAAALGAAGACVLTLCYRRLTLQVIKESLLGTLRVSGMVLLLMACAAGYSQFLAYTGATRELVRLVIDAPFDPKWIVAMMVGVVIVLGCFLEQVSIFMITLPLFMPVIHAFGLDPVWFGLIMLVAADMANLTPPFGLTLFVMKGVTPPEFTMGDIIRSAMPYVIIDGAVIGLMIAFPIISTWLPNLM